MTREEAITYLNVIWNRYKAEYEIERETIDAYHMAIEALSDDAVSREVYDTIEPNKIYCSPQLAHNVEVVVRCKDCKWREHIGCALSIADDSDKPKDNDFCSYGERREATIPTFTESAEAYKAWTGEEMGRTHGRLIDADKLKKQLDTVYNEMANERERKGLRLARWFLISAPTVSADRPHGEWIPRSERLPSESGDYLCTIPLDADETYMEVLTFHKGRFYEDDAEWGATFHDDVLAWMPLPKPYKGGDGE